VSSSIFTFDDVPFEQRLAETIRWCSSRGRIEDPRHSLRSESLQPRLLERDRASAVRIVASCRANLAGSLPMPVDGDTLRGCRLLVYFPDADLSDGAAEVASAGFFDVHNAPPWDTWVALSKQPSADDRSFQQYVISWVPRDFLQLAQNGIDVNPEACIRWLEAA
jgi:hypothetical protein